MANGINLDDYLDYLDQKNARNLGSTATTGLAINQGLSARESDKAALQEDPWKRRRERLGIGVVDEVKSENAALDFLGSMVWGGASGLAWGATEFVKESKSWEKMNDWERAGWVTGEGLSLFTPIVGPFALIGKGGQIATRALRGNNFIRKAASNLIKKEGLLAKEIVEEAVDRGVMPSSIRNDLVKQFKKQLPKSLEGNKYSRGRLLNLSSDSRTAETAAVGLRTQSEVVFDKIFKDYGLTASAGASRELSEKFVRELGENNRYVNDIGEWVTRSFGGSNPGRVSQYTGMAAQDFLYMGLHALGTEKIKSMAHGTEGNYADIPGHTSIMALGFPLIRGIGKGGRESLTRGIQGYFSRYRKINYNKISKMDGGDATARELLKSNIKGANINIDSSSDLGKKFWTVKGQPYLGKEDILAKVDSPTEMPLDHVVGLLNKMRNQVSKDLTNRWNSNYWGDLLASVPRMGTGVLFMNYGAFETGAFNNMSPQELSSHLFMSALMTKGKGAWDHAGRRGYISNEYGDMYKALNYLQVDHTKMGDTIKALHIEQLINERGVVYGHNPIAENILNTFDSVLEGESVDWRNRGEHISADKYADVKQLLSAYNAIKKQKNAAYDPITIEQMNPNALDMLKRDMGVVKIGDKTVAEMSPEDIKVMLSSETKGVIQSDYHSFLTLVNERMGIPFEVIPGSDERPIKAMAHKLVSRNDKDLFPNITEYNDLIVRYKAELGIDVVDKPRDVDRLAKDKGFKTLKDFDNALGTLTEQFVTDMAGKYQGHEMFLKFSDNIFLKGIQKINQIEAKDDFFKLVSGVGTDKQNIKTLREEFLNVFGKDGRLFKNIFENEIDKKATVEELSEADQTHLLQIKPIYDLIKALSPVGESKTPKMDIKSGDIKELAEQSMLIMNRLPSEWKLEPFVKGLESFQGRIFSGGNKMAFTAFSRARDNELITTIVENNVQKIIFPSEVAIENKFSGDIKTTRLVKESVDGIINLFKPQMVRRSHIAQENVDMSKWISINNEIVHSKVKDFVENIDSVLADLGNDSMVLKQIRSVKSLSEEIKNEILSPKATPDTNKIESALEQAKLIHKTLLAEGNISNDTSLKLESLITAMEQGYREMGELPPPTLSEANYGKMVESFDELIRTEMEVDHVQKSELSRLLVKIHNHAIGTDPNLTSADALLLFEKLNSEFHTITGNRLSKEVPIQDLIKEFNNTGNWRDAKAAIDAVIKTASRFNPHHDSYNKDAIKYLSELQNEKLGHDRPVNYQELLTKYPSIQDPGDPNSIKNRFVSDITDAFDGTKPNITPKGVMDEYIYNDIRQKHPNTHVAEIEKFNDTEMQPLLQNIFGKSKRRVISLDHHLLKMEDKDMRHSLSTRVLDRTNTRDPEKKYDWLLLKGTIKLGDRVINMDDSFEIGGDWNVMQKIIDNGIPVDMTKMENIAEQLRNVNFELKLLDLTQLKPIESEKSSKVYMRLSPKMRIIFPKTKDNIDLLNKDFDEVYIKKMDDYKGTFNKKRLNALRKGFEHLFDNTEQSNDILRTKMMFVHYNRTMGPEFDKMMNSMDQARGKIEYNSYKRGLLADGGTGTNLTRQALEWSAAHSPNLSVRAKDQQILNEGVKLAILNDEPADSKDDHFFSNKKVVLKQLADRVSNMVTTAGKETTESKIVNSFVSKITDGKYPSLESFFLDGGKFQGTPFAQSSRDKKGGGNWNGVKTTIMDNDLLGKGFSVYNPEIAYVLDGLGVDLLVGKTVAKTLNLGKVTPFTIDKSKVLEGGWEVELIGMDNKNFINIPYENFGISFTTHSDPGVNYSSSQFDFQGTIHLEHARKMYKIDEIIKKMSGVERNKEFANGDLLRALYKIRQEESGQQLTTDSYTLTEDLLRYGGRESNPLLQKAVIRLLQSDFYKILTHRMTRHGEEGISAVNMDNTLSNPVYAEIMGLPNEGTSNHAFQYGGGSITTTMAETLISRDVKSNKATVEDIPFIGRDPDTGLDIVFSFSEKGLEHYSPLLNAQEQAKHFAHTRSVGGIKGLGAGKWIKEDHNFKTHLHNMQKTLEHLNKQISGMKNVKYGDLIRLLKGEVFPRSKRHTGLVDVGLTQTYRDLAKKYNIQLGMSVNAIPKVMKDQPLLRIEKVLGRNEAGLATINPFDLRVTMQRDYDGDHIYKYLKMPLPMLKDYVDDMGDIEDYRKMTDIEYGEMNMFGFKDGVAGKDMDAIGFDRIAHDIAQKKKIVSNVISRKGTLSYLLNAGVKLDGESFVSESFKNKSVDLALTNALGVFQRGGDVFQNSLDVWKQTPKISRSLNAVENYFIYGEHPNLDKPHMDHNTTSFLKKGFGADEFQKSLFKIMHRTLSKTRSMDNDVHDAAGERQPTTDELRNNRDNIMSFFRNTDQYLIRSVLGDARRLRKKGGDKNRQDADDIVKNVLDFWFPEVYKGSSQRSKVREALERGDIPFESLKTRFTLAHKLGIKSSMSGYVLNELIANPVFYERDNKAEADKNRTIFQHFNNLRDKIEIIFSYGDVTPEKLDEMVLKDQAFTETVDGTSVFKSNLSGIVRFVASNQYERSLGSLRMLKNENFPDKNKIERAEDRVSTIKSVIDVLDRQMARDVILRKDKDIIMKQVKAPKDKDFKWDYVDFNAYGTLYRIKGDVSKKDLDRFKHPPSLEYIGPVKKGKKQRVMNGYTYLVDRNPPKFMSVDDPDVRWNRAWMQTTQVGLLKARDVDISFNPDYNPSGFTRFADGTDKLRRGVSDSYSKTLDAAQENLVDSKDIHFYNSVITDRMIGKYFKDFSTPNNFEKLLRYLLQPQKQRNVYIKEGSEEMPYFKMNTHLIESVFNWMRRKPTQGELSNEIQFGFNAEMMIRGIMSDMNAWHDHKTGHVEYQAQQYMRMRKGGLQDWNKLKESTGDLIMGDWYHHPVLSKYSRDFFLGRGDYVRGKDINGKDSYFYDYRNNRIDLNMEKIMGCK